MFVYCQSIAQEGRWEMYKDVKGICNVDNFWNDESGYGFPDQAYDGDLTKLAERLDVILQPKSDEKYSAEVRIVVSCDGDLVHCEAAMGKKDDPVIGEKIESVFVGETQWVRHQQHGQPGTYVDYEFIYFVQVKKGVLTLNEFGG